MARCGRRAFVSTGALPRPAEVRARRRGVPALRAGPTGEVSQVYPAPRPSRPRPVRDRRHGRLGCNGLRGREHRPVRDHERGQAVRVRAGCVALGAARRGRGSVPTRPACRSTRCRRSSAAPMAGPTPWSTRAPSRPPGWSRTAIPVAQHGSGSSSGLSAFAGRPLAVDEEVLASASATNHRNRALAQFLYARGVLGTLPRRDRQLYTRQRRRGHRGRPRRMGATLADAGVHPGTGARVVDSADMSRDADDDARRRDVREFGDWLYDVGLPGKSGIGGGIVTVAPGKGALGTFSPPLDAAGNSVRGTSQRRLPVPHARHGHPLASAPVPPAPTS